MFILFWALVNLPVHAKPTIDEISKGQAERLLYSADEHSPYGRLSIAMTAMENDIDDSTLFALASTHPTIAEMLLIAEYKVALQYLLHLPSTARHKLRKGDSVIRTPDQMSKLEKKYGTQLAKEMDIPKKIHAIRIGSFDGISLDIEVSYKKSGQIQKQALRMAGPSAPFANQQSQQKIGRVMGRRPSPPLSGARSLMAFSSGSFEQGLQPWNRSEGFRFEATQPIGVVGLDDNTSMDGQHALRFYNTDKTRIFESIQQSVPLRDATRIQLKCFVQAEKASVEYRQDSSYTFVALRYLDEQEQVVQEDKKLIRLGSYTWESLIIDSSVPAEAVTVSVVLLSSVSGTIWIDGISFLRME